MATRKRPSGNPVSKTLIAPALEMAAILGLAERAKGAMESIRGALLDGVGKTAPNINATTLAALCGVEKPHINYRIQRGDLPEGSASGGKREFTLGEAQQWTRAFRADRLRPQGQRALTISVGNFKGGVGKTSAAMALAQGLSLRGHRVLAIDADPQGSLTTLFGIVPQADVVASQTIIPAFRDQADLAGSVQKTYWEGVDLIAAAPFLYTAEVWIPKQRERDPRARIWDMLNVALEGVRDHYDVIVIDTPPTLGFVTMNAFMASDGIIVPIPPSALDYASASQFWELFADLLQNVGKEERVSKTFDFVRVVLSIVDNTDTAVAAMREWIYRTYGEFVLPVEILKTSVTPSQAAELGTVYDVERYHGDSRTYRRARESYERFVDLVDEALQQAWLRRMETKLPQAGGGEA